MCSHAGVVTMRRFSVLSSKFARMDEKKEHTHTYTQVNDNINININININTAIDAYDLRTYLPIYVCV